MLPALALLAALALTAGGPPATRVLVFRGGGSAAAEFDSDADADAFERAARTAPGVMGVGETLPEAVEDARCRQLPRREPLAE